MGNTQPAIKRKRVPSLLRFYPPRRNSQILANCMPHVPDEIILNIINQISDAPTFQSFSLVCCRISRITQDPSIQHLIKTKFCVSVTSILAVTPQEETGIVSIRYHQQLPCGQFYGQDSVWTYSVQLPANYQDENDLPKNLVDSASSKLQVSTRTWKDNVIVGEERGYFPDGNLQFIRYWNENGMLDGEEKIFYPNGQVRAHNFRCNGVLEGVQQAWYEHGGRCFVRLWRNGVREGPEKYWSKDGRLTQRVWRKGKKSDPKSKLLFLRV